MISWLTMVPKNGRAWLDGWTTERVTLQSPEEMLVRNLAADLYHNIREFRRANYSADKLKLLLPTAGLRSDDITALHGGTVLGVPIQLCGDLDWPMLATPLKVKEIPER